MDVNTLIALVDPDHIEHQTMQRWFSRHHMSGWATCPIAENGMIRVLSQPSYPSGQHTPAEVTQILSDLKRSFAKSHHFWPDDISLTDDSVFDKALIAGPRQVTDIYLLALAARHKASLLSFDRSLAWHAVRGGSAQLIQRPT